MRTPLSLSMLRIMLSRDIVTISQPRQEGYMGDGGDTDLTRVGPGSGENLVTPLISLFGNTLYVMVIALWQYGNGEENLNGNTEATAITPQRES